MQHQTIFADKFLNIKMKLYELESSIEGLEEKKGVIKNWIQQIQSGRIDSEKEEAIQADFLNRFFGDVLGYDYRSPEAWKLEKEIKTPVDGTKADGGLGYFYNNQGKKDFADVRVAIELKDGRTNLDKPQNRKNDKRTPVEQAFGYANKFGESCQWIIVSNFKEIRLYNKRLGQARYEVWYIPQLLQDSQLKRFFFLLNHDRLFLKNSQSPIEHLFETRQAEEEKISKAFYTEYKETRLKLFAHIKDANPEYDELELFGKAQKLLDRIIFICFCEDFNIIPYFTFRKLIKVVEQDVFSMSDDSMYQRVKGLFHSIDKGNPAANINRFNGGLFAPDEMLDSLKIKDNILEPVIKLSEYDFATDLNVNILGHIFEQSISDIEELKAEIRGEVFDKSKGKRKKDGIFYTPEYITRYIVDKAVGGWLRDRKAELNEDSLPELTNQDYASIKISAKGKLSTNAKIKKHIQFWEAYKAKLQHIKVIDPACGSGAFLNQVFDFLYQEGQVVNAELASLRGGQQDIFALDKHILSNNIYGVDLNPESVQITKLSLWLKTANSNSELTALDDNILVGNSLIDDKEVAGESAFDWEVGFKEIFKKGGFDVVVGNPPYVRQELLGEIKPFLEKNFQSFAGTADLFTYFYEKGITILNEKGILSFITNDFNKTTSSTPLRAFLQENASFISFDDFSEVDVFKGTTTYPVIITAYQKGKRDEFLYCKFNQDDVMDVQTAFNEKAFPVRQDSLDSTNWTFKSDIEVELFQKLKKYPKVRDTIDKCFYGIKTGFNEAFIIDLEIRNSIVSKNDSDKALIKPFFEGKDIKKWESPAIEKWIIFTRRGIEINEYPAIFDWLNQYRERLTPRNSPEQKIGRKAGKYEWFEIQDSVDYFELFEKPKITWTNLQNANKFSFDDSGRYINAPAVILPTDDKALLGILNSKLVWYFLTQICVVRSGGYIEVKPQYFEQIPIADYASQKENLLDLVELQINRTNTFHNKESRFLKRVTNSFHLDKLSKKLESFYDHDFKTFLSELKKKKIKLSLSQQDEWEEYFESYQNEIQQINAEIRQTDRAIDRMVYGLYGLTEAEVGIVEGESN